MDKDKTCIDQEIIESNNLTILTNGAGGIITSVCICEENYPGLDGGFTLFAIVCCVSQFFPEQWHLMEGLKYDAI